VALSDRSSLRFYQLVVHALGSMSFREMATVMFRHDPDPEVEALRHESVRRVRPLLVMLGAGAVIWAVGMVAVTAFLLIHWLVA